MTAAEIIRLARAKGRRVLFTVPAIELVDQTAREFWREGIREVGVMQGDHVMTDRSQPVQIASVQTLAKRVAPDFDFALVDEAHRVFASLDKLMAENPDKPFVGLTATPWTKGLGKRFDRLIIGATTRELIDAGYLSDFRVFAPSHPDLTGVRTVRGDYDSDGLSEAMSAGTLTADIVTTWLERAEGRPTLVFAVDRAHAAKLEAEFRARGVATGYVDGFTDKPDRERVRRQFESGEIKVVCNVGVLTTGVDWDVRCIVLARPTKSEMLFVQIVGRGLRTAPGKDDCLILDHSDTTLRLGFVTDIHHEDLDDGERRDAAVRKAEPPKPKDCPSCHRVRPPGVAVCPSCGFKPAPKASTVETAEGELIELDGRRKKLNRDATWPEKAAWIAQVRAAALLKGKGAGWVSQQYKTKFGVWPNDPRVSAVPAAGGVGPEVAGWLKSRAIAYAKGRAAGRRFG